jgi:hypothetical protein
LHPYKEDSRLFLGEMMKRYVFAGFTFCLVIGFQNCSKNNFTDMNQGDALGNPAVATPIEKLDVSQTEKIEIPESSYLESKLQADILQTKATSNFSTHHLEIEVRTGVIQVIEDNNGEAIQGLQYCLNSQDVAALNSILSSSNICEDKVANTGHDQVCTMEYKFPYAKLHIADAEPVNLGEVFNACSKGFDLCGDQKELLQNYLGQVQSSLDSKKCDFQVVGQ